MFAVVNGQTSTEMVEVSAQVEINGTTYDWMTCTAIEHSVGIVPSKARIRIGGGNYDVTGPITLNAVKWPFMAGSRVKIYADNSDVLFMGQLRKRVDNGGEDSIEWEAWDDRWLLMQIPVRGCIVYDPYPANTPKFIPRYECRTNPGGYWNCTGAKIKGTVYPVFSAIAEIGQTYEAPDSVFTEALVEGKLTAWTPRRFLQYLNLLANLKAGDLPGIETDAWRSLASSKRLQWPASSMQLVGKDLAQTVDPLDYKMKDHKFQGMRMLGAIDDTLKIAGTHGLKLSYTESSSANLVSMVDFYPERANAGRPKGLMSIPMARGGQATDINTAFDFALEDDAGPVSESVLDEGAPVRVESSFAFDTTASATTLVPAWSSIEEQAFIDCCMGNKNESGTTLHAWYPKTQGGTAKEDRLYADGNGGRPLALAGTSDAVNLARKCFPKVFRAYSIDSNQAFSTGILQGYNNAYATAPCILGIPRPALPQQLQFYIESVTGSGTDISNRLKEYFDIRIEVSTNDVADSSSAVGFHDVADNSGLRIKENGLIYLDGLAENVEGTSDCVYSGTLKVVASDPPPSAPPAKKRYVRLNIAVPLDVRVRGYVERKKADSQLDPALFSDLGGPFLTYLDQLDSFIEHNQVKSRPTPSVEYFGGSDGTSTATIDANGAVSRIVPPGSEQPHALYAAQRKLASTQNPARRSSWKLIGIRPEYYIGLWIDSLHPVNGAQGDSDYDINSPIRTVVYDFMNQQTIIGGLLSMLSTNTPKAGARTMAASINGPRGGGQASPDKAGPARPSKAAYNQAVQDAMKNGPQDE